MSHGKVNIERIALIFEFNTLNGGERSMLAVLDRLVQHRSDDEVPQFEFTAIAPPSGPLSDALTERGIPVHPLPLRDENGKRLPLQTLLCQLKMLICRLNVDLVHANSLSMGRLTGAIAGDLSIPTVAHIRDILTLSRTAVGNLNRNRKMIAVSAATRSFHLAQGLDPNRIDVVHNGIDCEKFQPRDSSDWREKELGVKPSEILIATIGQIGLRKGLDVLAEAAALNAERLPQVHYMLIGTRHSTKLESVRYEQDVTQRFADAGLIDRFHRLGFRSDVPRLLNEANLLVHAAHQEPLGRVLLESAAAGLPVIATAVGGTTEIFADGVSARLVPPANAWALSEAIAEFVDDEEMRNRLAVAARSRVLKRFTIAEAARKLTSVWADVLSKPVAPPTAETLT